MAVCVSVCERVPDGVLQVGFQTDVSNGLLFFLIQLAQGFFERSVTFFGQPFFFLHTLFALDEKDVGPSTCCYLILAMEFHCVGFVCTRALTAMFALSVLTPSPLCKCPRLGCRHPQSSFVNGDAILSWGSGIRHCQLARPLPS
jgi:hypothetical protein